MKQYEARVLYKNGIWTPLVNSEGMVIQGNNFEDVKKRALESYVPEKDCNLIVAKVTIRELFRK